MGSARNRQALAELQSLFTHGSFVGVTDAELLEHFHRGHARSSEQAFAAIVERHGAMVLRTCRLILDNSADAEDAFQVTFLVLARRAGSIRRPDALASWLHGVARRTSCYARGAKIRRRKHESRVASQAPEATLDPPTDDIPRLIHEEIARLPERFRLPLILCELEGRSLEEAARAVGCPVGTIKSRLSRGRARIELRLRRRGVGPEWAGFAMLPEGVPRTLVETTTAAVAVSRGLQLGPPISAALAAWEVWVVRSLLMARLIKALTVLALTALASGGAIFAYAQSNGPSLETKKVVATTIQATPPSELLGVLARSRIEAARRVRDVYEQSVQAGQSSVQELYEAELRLLDAELAACDTRDDQLAVMREQLKGLTAIESLVRKLRERAQVSQTDVWLAEYRRLDIALKVAELETGEKPRRRETLDEALNQPDRAKTVIERFYKDQLNQALRAILRRTITVEFDTTLESALKFFKSESTGPFDNGIPIFVNPDGLTRAKLTMQSPVKIPRTRGTIDELLARTLEPLGLKHEVRDGMIEITAK